MENSIGVVVFNATTEQINKNDEKTLSSKDAISFIVESQNISASGKKKLIDKYIVNHSDFSIRSTKNVGKLISIYFQGPIWQDFLDDVMKKNKNPGFLQGEENEFYSWSRANGVHRYHLYNVFGEKSSRKFTEKAVGEFETMKHARTFVEWHDMIQSNYLEEEMIDVFLDDQFDWAYKLWEER